MPINPINSAAGATVKGVDQVLSGLDKARKSSEKNLNTSIRVEGFRLRNLLKDEIRSGSPGGRPFAPLSIIASKLGRRKNRKPLNRLAIGVRYQVASQSPFAMAIGWVGPETGFDARQAITADPFGRGILARHVTSKSWRRLAEFHQEGFTREITDAQREYIIRRGSKIEKGTWRPFFLKKSTRMFRTPARPIISPFWQAHGLDATRKIKENFKRKMRGERI